MTRSDPVSGVRAVNVRLLLGSFATAIVVAPALADDPPLGHSRSSTIAFSVAVGIMNALRSPRNTSSARVSRAPDSSCGDMEACVTFRTGGSDGRAPSRSAAAASTSLPSRSGHRTETVVSPSSGANTFSASTSAPSETSKDALDEIAARALLSCVKKAAAGLALNAANVSARKLACAWSDFESSTATKVTPRSLTPTRTTCFFDRRSAERTCVNVRTCSTTASSAYSSAIGAANARARAGSEKHDASNVASDATSLRRAPGGILVSRAQTRIVARVSTGNRSQTFTPEGEFQIDR